MDTMTFRKAMGKFATGVTVITTKLEGETHGMTANAFMSISLDPMLVTISIDHRAKMLDKLKMAGEYAVSFLAENQVDISMHFANQKKLTRELQFDYLQNMPIIKGSLAAVVCKVVNQFEVGDHTLFIGEVKDIQVNEGEPLTFYSGKYGRLEKLAE